MFPLRFLGFLLFSFDVFLLADDFNFFGFEFTHEAHYHGQARKLQVTCVILPRPKERTHPFTPLKPKKEAGASFLVKPSFVWQDKQPRLPLVHEHV